MPLMAQRIVTELTDDTNGKPADETVTFGLDGREYEIDLTSKNAAALRKAFDVHPDDLGLLELLAVPWRGGHEGRSPVGRRERVRAVVPRAHPGQRRRGVPGRSGVTLPRRSGSDLGARPQ